MKLIVDIPDGVDLSKLEDVQILLKYRKDDGERYEYLTKGFVLREDKDETDN